MAEIIYVCRHGQTTYNIDGPPEGPKGRLGGDPPLTAEGLRQARLIGTLLSRQELGQLYCSDTRRALDTAREIRRFHPGKSLNQTPRLRELYHGKLNELLTADFPKLHPELHRERYKDRFSWGFPEGESYRSMIDNRIRPFLQTLEDQPGTVALVAHRGTNRCLLGTLLKVKPEDIINIRVPQDGYYEVMPASGQVRFCGESACVEGLLFEN